MKRAKTKNKIAKVSIFSFALSFFLYAFFVVSILQLGVDMNKKKTEANVLEAQLASLEGSYFSSVQDTRSREVVEENAFTMEKVPVLYAKTKEHKKFVYLDNLARGIRY